MRAGIFSSYTQAGLLAVVLLAAAGCSASRTVPVKGQIFWDDGTPARQLTGYIVESSVPGSSVSSRGDVDEEGRFVLSTSELGDGAEPGTHLVLIAPIPRAEFEPPPKIKLPARYAKAETSGLTFTVERSKGNDVTLTISRK